MGVAISHAGIDARHLERHLHATSLRMLLVGGQGGFDLLEPPRTVVIIMCLTENSTLEWAGSSRQVEVPV